MNDNEFLANLLTYVNGICESDVTLRDDSSYSDYAEAVEEVKRLDKAITEILNKLTTYLEQK